MFNFLGARHLFLIDLKALKVDRNVIHCPIKLNLVFVTVWILITIFEVNVENSKNQGLYLKNCPICTIIFWLSGFQEDHFVI